MRALSEVRKEQLVGFFSCCVAAQLPCCMESMRPYFGYVATRTQSVCVRLCTGLCTLELSYRAKTCGCGFAFSYEFGSLTSAPAPGKLARQASLSITNSQSLLKLMSFELVMPSNHLILCRPLLLQPSIFPSIRVFSNESALCIRWPTYWSFSFSISPSNEYSGLISFRTDWFDFLAVQGTLKSLLQHHSSKTSIIWSSAFFIVQLSHPCVTSGKTIALTRWNFFVKYVSAL